MGPGFYVVNNSALDVQKQALFIETCRLDKHQPQCSDKIHSVTHYKLESLMGIKLNSTEVNVVTTESGRYSVVNLIN